MKRTIVTLSALGLLGASLYAQEVPKNRGIFIEPKSEFFDSIEASAKKFNTKPEEKKKSFKMDFTGIDIPKSIKEFKTFWHNEPLSQGITGTCWDFSTTSYLESEAYRLHGTKIKLSEMYTAYWEYVEKARRFIEERGNSNFDEGSEANAVTRIWKSYGVVPEAAYSGLLKGQTFHDHSAMAAEMKTYLNGLKNSGSWNEQEAIGTIKSIMNHYMGLPPEKFSYEGKEYSPKEFLKNYVRIDPDNYLSVISLLSEPYYTKMEYKVADNWNHNKEYYNVPLDVFMNLVKHSVRKGLSIAIGGDVSEAGFESHLKAALIPSFDIPESYIDDQARQFRFSNESTQDDHGIHIVGYCNKGGKDWYLIKDSGAGSFNTGDKGYMFYREDYIKLKIIDIFLPKDQIKEVLEKFK